MCSIRMTTTASGSSIHCVRNSATCWLPRSFDNHMALRGERAATAKVGPDSQDEGLCAQKPSDLSTIYFLKLA